MALSSELIGLFEQLKQAAISKNRENSINTMMLIGNKIRWYIISTEEQKESISFLITNFPEDAKRLFSDWTSHLVDHEADGELMRLCRTFIAIAEQHDEMLEQLSSFNNDRLSRDSQFFGYTLLHHAACCENLPLLSKLLITGKVDLTLQTPKKETAMDLAVKRRNWENVYRLIIYCQYINKIRPPAEAHYDVALAAAIAENKDDFVARLNDLGVVTPNFAIADQLFLLHRAITVENIPQMITLLKAGVSITSNYGRSP